jgi:hypothetical protein
MLGSWAGATLKVASRLVPLRRSEASVLWMWPQACSTLLRLRMPVTSTVRCIIRQKLALSHIPPLAWGSNQQNQCGLGDACAAVTVPTLVPLPLAAVASVGPAGPVSRMHVVCAVACGAAHTLAATEAGECLAWGLNVQGQL